MRIAGWLLTYLLPWTLLAHGTVNNGDDTPWILSLFCFAPVVAVGLVLLARRWGNLWSSRWLGLSHISTLVLAARVLPDYWRRVTLGGDHIAAGFSADYVHAFQPSFWHSFWAPVMTLLVLGVLFFNVLSWVPRHEHQK